MNELSTRTPSIIATEINSIKEQTQKMLLFNSIEIGRRLVEAKQMLPHGQWGEWLEQYVDYSQRTASNLMKIFDEYGSKQITLFGSNANSQALANLSYTQAVALLGIPQDEREGFVKENDIDSMSTRELQQAIREKQDLAMRLVKAEEAKKTAEKSLEDALKQAEKEHRSFETVSESYDRLEKTNQKHYETAERLEKELKEAKASGDNAKAGKLQAELNQTNQELQEAQRKVQHLTEELNKPVEPVIVTKVPEEVERELEELRAKTKDLEGKANQQSNEALLKFKVQFDTLVKGFGELLNVLTEIEDSETREKYKGAVTQLISKMSARL